jgi:hypothetical protein
VEEEKDGKSTKVFPAVDIGVAGGARLQPFLQGVLAGVPLPIEFSSEVGEDLGKIENSLSILIRISDSLS